MRPIDLQKVDLENTCGWLLYSLEQGSSDKERMGFFFRELSKFARSRGSDELIVPFNPVRAINAIETFIEFIDEFFGRSDMSTQLRIRLGSLIRWSKETAQEVCYGYQEENRLCGLGTVLVLSTDLRPEHMFSFARGFRNPLLAPELTRHVALRGLDHHCKQTISHPLANFGVFRSLVELLTAFSSEAFKDGGRYPETAQLIQTLEKVKAAAVKKRMPAEIVDPLTQLIESVQANNLSEDSVLKSISELHARMLSRVQLEKPKQ